MSDNDYYRGRERAEREAATRAACPQAQRAHEEMARAYGRLLGGGPKSRASFRF